MPIVLGIFATSCPYPIEIHRAENNLPKDKKGNKPSLNLAEVLPPAKPPVITDSKKSKSPKPSTQVVVNPVKIPALLSVGPIAIPPPVSVNQPLLPAEEVPGQQPVIAPSIVNQEEAEKLKEEQKRNTEEQERKAKEQVRLAQEQEAARLAEQKRNAEEQLAADKLEKEKEAAKLAEVARLEKERLEKEEEQRRKVEEIEKNRAARIENPFLDIKLKIKDPNNKINAVVTNPDKEGKFTITWDKMSCHQNIDEQNFTLLGKHSLYLISVKGNPAAVDNPDDEGYSTLDGSETDIFIGIWGQKKPLYDQGKTKFFFEGSIKKDELPNFQTRDYKISYYSEDSDIPCKDAYTVVADNPALPILAEVTVTLAAAP